MSILGSTPNEKKSLAAHVDLCAQRYATLEERMTNLESKTDKIEAKLDGIEAKIDHFKDEIAWLLIKGALGIIIALIGSIATILKLFGHW